MRTQKTLLLSSLLASCLVIAVGATQFMGSSQPKADADTFIPGYTKHCPIYLMYELNGESMYMTQNEDHCGSDFVASGYHMITGGCYECGWPQDCWDPILVPNETATANPVQGPPPPPEEGGSGSGGSGSGGSGSGGSGSGGSGYDPGSSDPGMEPYNDPYNDPAYDPYMTSLDQKVKAKLDNLSGRHFVVTVQQNYVPARFGDQGDSRRDLGKLKLKSRYITHTQDSDFVAKVKSIDGTEHYFRVFELAVETKSAEKKFVRFGQELSPASITPDMEVRPATLKSSRTAQTHQIALTNDKESREYLVTTVSPIQK